MQQLHRCLSVRDRFGLEWNSNCGPYHDDAVKRNVAKKRLSLTKGLGINQEVQIKRCDMSAASFSLMPPRFDLPIV